MDIVAFMHGDVGRIVSVNINTNVEKNTLNPEITLLFINFILNALLKVPKICNINFWIGNAPPPPFGTFPKIHPIW